VADAEATVEEEPEASAEELPEAPPEAVEPRQPEPPAKDEKKDRGKKGKRSEPAELPDGPSIAGHPRAVRSVERAKGWGALAGLLGGFYFSLPTHTPAEAGLRALIAGVVLYVAAWAGSVFFWRRMVMVEIRAREQELIVAARAALARADGPAPDLGGGERG
jgi:hypothetical protein